jgi:hypothetical protein
VIYGENLLAQEAPARCRVCSRVASVEVLDAAGSSHGCFCLRCGRDAFRTLERQEALAARKMT